MMSDSKTRHGIIGYIEKSLSYAQRYSTGLEGFRYSLADLLEGITAANSMLFFFSVLAHLKI